MFVGDDIDKKVGKKVKLVLRNKNYYEGIIESAGDRYFLLKDIRGRLVEISVDEISEIIEDDS